jgi:hypothetical protein
VVTAEARSPLIGMVEHLGRAAGSHRLNAYAITHITFVPVRVLPCVSGPRVSGKVSGNVAQL